MGSEKSEERGGCTLDVMYERRVNQKRKGKIVIKGETIFKNVQKQNKKEREKNPSSKFQYIEER